MIDTCTYCKKKFPELLTLPNQIKRSESQEGRLAKLRLSDKVSTLPFSGTRAAIWLIARLSPCHPYRETLTTQAWVPQNFTNGKPTIIST